MTDASPPCPCGSGATTEACCGPIVAGDRPAPTAERLMRSRFTAFVVGDDGHLLRSWHPSTRPVRIRSAPDRRWTRLEVVAAEGGGLLDRDGVVEFRAHHRTGDRDGVLHERSRFVRDDGRWTYLGPAEDPLG
jgi:SEC-C motif domain protein